MTYDDSLSQGASRKRPFQFEIPGDSKKSRTAEKTEDNEMAVKRNECEEYKNEIEKLKEVLSQRDNEVSSLQKVLSQRDKEISTLHKIISSLTRKQGL